MKSSAGIRQLVARSEKLRVSLLGSGRPPIQTYDRESLAGVMQAMENELLIRAASDRELMIRTAALVCGDITSRYNLGTTEGAAQAVKLARAIISAVDSEHTKDSQR